MVEEEVLTVLLTRNTAFRNSHNNLKITIYLEYNDKFHLLRKYQELFYAFWVLNRKVLSRNNGQI